jgi:NADPH:quinone reductase-like Zn-dependent oxidoreductase
MDTSTSGWPKERDCFCHSKFLGATFENNTVFIFDKNTNSCNSNFRIAGKVAIVTGVASGIGAATVNLLHENGAKVVIADIQDTLGQEIADKLGENVCYIHCDVSNEDDIINLVNTTVAKLWKLEIM